MHWDYGTADVIHRSLVYIVWHARVAKAEASLYEGVELGGQDDKYVDMLFLKVLVTSKAVFSLLTLVLLNCLRVFFIHLELELLT